MDYIYKEQVLNINIDVFKGQSTVKEDFSRAELKVFLVCGVEKLRIPLIVTLTEMGTLTGSVSNLPVGVYGIKVIWNKNHGRRHMIAERYQMFGITEYADEATNATADNVTLKVKLYAMTYGYDGLDAYELSVLRGKTTLSEEDWLNKINSGGGSEPTFVLGDWSLKFDIKNDYLNIGGDLTTIPFAASVTRIKRWSDGRPDEVVAGNVVLSANIEGVRFDKNGGTIEIGANATTEARDIVITASGEGCTPIVKTIKQLPQANIFVKKVEDEEGTILPFDSNEVNINDAATLIYLDKVGNVGEISVATTDSWLNVGFEGDTIGISPVGATEDIRIGIVKVTYADGKTKEIEVVQSYITNVSYETTATLSYPKIKAEGGSVNPSVEINQTRKEERSNGTIVKNAVDTSEAVMTFSDDSGLVDGSTGVISYDGKNNNQTDKLVTKVTMQVELNGETASVDYNVYQSALVLKILMGVLPKSISNFNWSSKVDDIKASDLEHCLTAKGADGKAYIEAVGDVTSASPKVYTVDECGYLIGLVPVAASSNARFIKKWDGFSPQTASSAWVKLEENEGFYCNGEREITVNNIPYKLFANFASDETKFTVINKE